ncbi:hypothetical protein SAMN05216390_101489 [Lachnospiraceae bacterium KH1T2]|nr:hypothetical protein SAMN05216390_101489 [Lachnospiraceae bacterium KH1T2]
MNNQTQITQKQNEENMLKCQFASHICFNQAEMLNYFSWFLSIIGSLLVFTPSEETSFLIIIPGILGIMTLVSHNLAKNNVKWGAKMRNYFDNEVFGLEKPEYTAEVTHSIWEKINSIENKYSRLCQYSIHATDQSDTPGMKDWYTFPKNYTTSEAAVFECQHQNYWWTNKEYNIRRIIYLIAFSVLIIAIIVGIHYSPIKTLACFLGFAVNLYEDFSESIRCHELMVSMKTILDNPDAESNLSLISQLQNYIEKRRELLILEIDLIHKKNAKKWSTLYKSIFNYQHTHD